MSISIEVLSGLLPKAPAAILLTIDNKRFLLDAGACIGTTEIPWCLSDEIDAVFISHDHHDHLGGIKKIPRHIPIYCSAFVATKLSLHDNVHVLPANGCSDIMGIQVQSGSNGHALGGLWFHFNVEGGLFYSGDYCLESDTYRFDFPPVAKTALLDMSYGGYNTPLIKQQEQLSDELNEIRHIGSILLPVPASGRSIELAIWLEEHFSWQICFDENGFQHIQQALQLEDAGLTPRVISRLNNLCQSACVIDNTFNIGPMDIILAGSPDLDGGLAKTLIDMDISLVQKTIFTGHIGEYAKELCQQKRASFTRWNVHPTLSDSIALTQHLQCQTLIPLFHPNLASLETEMFNSDVHTHSYWEPSYATS
ncbi:MBL fold metallo-hydrolase [Vibrio sp. VB16]|uniref:MBL fold metallo-hydrolase n=1 Tax=Vibrio sp. VB16 TaxID=2785746 RepID=UPI00189CDF36|nr:MBL fold metallo-hydrolase [Vibrio sp. VB16]UGA53591.1 MBL fold metallo-hydrolase [Vibrio sp. VB16]